MNTAFNSALKQSTSIRRDLATLSASSGTSSTTEPATPTTPELTPAALGSLSASLTALSRTLDEYNTLAKQELNPAKQEKAFERVKNFRSELASFRAEFAALKSQREVQNRSELLGRRPYVNATPENPYAHTQQQQHQHHQGGGGAGSPFGGAAARAGPANSYASSGAMAGAGAGAEDQRESHALREQQFFSSTHSALDDYIARGQAVLGDLGQQREVLKGTQRRLYSVANTLGVSGDTIRMIERRARQDKWIFWAGVVVFFLFCWLCLHFLR